MYYAKRMLSILDRVSIFDLGCSDGCMCLYFSAAGFSVDISCHKSSGASMFPNFRGITIRVYSGHMDIGPDDLELVARRIVASVHDASKYSELLLRYCDWKHDKDNKCVYCGDPRARLTDYLCAKCIVGKSPFGQAIADTKDYSRIHFVLPEPGGLDADNSSSGGTLGP